jgi:hypothetical protein
VIGRRGGFQPPHDDSSQGGPFERSTLIFRWSIIFLANSEKPHLTPAMFRVLAAVCVSAFAVLSASCCCTGEPEANPLRPLPQFQEVPAAPEVNYAK